MVGVVLLTTSWIGTNLENAIIVNIHRVIRFGIPFALISYGLVSIEIMSTKWFSKKKNFIISGGSYSVYLTHYLMSALDNEELLRTIEITAFMAHL